MKIETYKNIGDVCQVTVKPNSKQKKLIKINQNEFVAYIKAKPEKGKANIAVIEVLSLHFRVPKSKIELISGHRDKHKVFEIISNQI